MSPLSARLRRGGPWTSFSSAQRVESQRILLLATSLLSVLGSALPAWEWWVSRGQYGRQSEGKARSIFISALDMLSRHFSMQEVVINISASSFRLR
mmetsp:Transcript_21789/g.43643  ORF Transcript_21789/g.43643 Transcript_21789/m.43643 type:complete len:96 (-) Transcript_21789:105-392(-)